MENPESPHSKGEKRHLGRVNFVTEIILTPAGGAQKSYRETNNLSMNGVFIATDSPLDVGTEGEFKLVLKTGDSDGTPIMGWYRVVNIHEKAGKKGMGVNFMKIGTDDSLLLYKIIRYNNPD